MENEILTILNVISFQSLIIGISVCIFTMLIKFPIKKATSKLEESKRKLINSLIIIIPITLSFAISLIYCGIVDNEWLSFNCLELFSSSCAISFVAYAFYERLKIVFKGLKSSHQTSETQESIKFLTHTIEALSEKLNIDKDKLKDLQEKISSLFELKQKLELENDSNLDIYTENNISIQNLALEEDELKKEIESTMKTLQEYQTRLEI